jgi:serine/threonine protein kinase
MPQVKVCPECRAELSADAPLGLCPKCAELHGLETRPAAPASGENSGTPPLRGPFRAPEPAELAAHFPQLEILELLGQGGMGAVYKARQPKLDRLAAIKILPPEVGDSAFADRFTREARALARLNHPNIITVYDFGETSGLYYFLMEYVEGASLRQRLQAGKFSVPDVLRIVPQICEALQFAHDEGIVHRDIKPENILLDRRGRVKIADFGIAKILSNKTKDYTLTGPWQVMGTLNYMAPEQMDSPLKVDHRADIYSLGVVFYELLTNQIPRGRFAPPSQAAGVDPQLDPIVLRALASEPAQRYQHVSELRTAVERTAKDAEPVLTVIGVDEQPVRKLRKTDPAHTRRQPEPLPRAGCFLGLGRFLATVMCLIGCLLFFFPWISVHGFGAPGGPVVVLPGLPEGGAYRGYDFWQSTVVCALFFTLAASMILIPKHNKLLRWRPALFVAAGLIMTVLSGYLANEGVSVLERSGRVVPGARGEATSAAWCSTGFSVYLLLLGCIELRALLNARTRSSLPALR